MYTTITLVEYYNYTNHSCVVAGSTVSKQIEVINIKWTYTVESIYNGIDNMLLTKTFVFKLLLEDMPNQNILVWIGS